MIEVEHHLVIGTAGHVDHGKTTLIRALTGSDTDRLPEEKKRGISIELGFARFRLPSGREASVIDVPGHERFIKNMVAGVAGIDLVLLVIAADEGIMPQTREHVDILQLLGVRNGLIVLNKSDLVDSEWLDLVREDIREELAGTFLEEAPLFTVSATTGDGLDQLLHALDEMLPQVNIPERPRKVRLPIDRVFTIAGFGTVVTGTLLGGRLQPDQRLVIEPIGIEVRVRQVQVHNEIVPEAVAGQRVAVNITGVDKDAVDRGMTLVEVGSWKASTLIAAEVYMLERIDGVLKNNQRVRWHSGTSEIIGRVLLLDRDELLPGDSTFMLFKAEEPVLVVRDDRFIVRTYSPMNTIAGGRVLVTDKRYKRYNPRDLRELSLISSDDQSELLLALVGESPQTRETLSLKLGISLDKVDEAVEKLGKDVFVVAGSWIVSKQVWERYRTTVLSLLEDYHRTNRLSRGMSREELRSQVGKWIEPRVGNELLEMLVAEESIEIEKDLVRLVHWQPRLSEEEKQTTEHLLRLLDEGGFSPPTAAECAPVIGRSLEDTRDLLKYLADRGEIVKIDQDLYFTRDKVQAAVERVTDYLRNNDSMTLAELRDLLQTTRKYALPLAEYFDLIRVTRRIGDKRQLF